MTPDYGPGDVVQCIGFTESCPHCHTHISKPTFNAPVIGRYYRCAQVVSARCGACGTRVQGMLPAALDLGGHGTVQYVWFYPDFRKIEPSTESLSDLIAANQPTQPAKPKEPAL